MGGEGFAIDASVIQADARRGSGFRGCELASRKLDGEQATRAVREYLLLPGQRTPCPRPCRQLVRPPTSTHGGKALVPRLGMCGDHRDEQPTVVNSLTDLMVPGIPTAQLTLVEPDLDAC